MNLLCPACHTPLPDVAVSPSDMVVACPACSAEIDVSRAGTQAGRPRFVPEIDRTGATIGGFRIEALIGGGGMGTVYRALGPGGAVVAVKVLAQALGDDPAFVARFAREVETLSRLDHPAIVRVLGNGTDGGIPWFAMELVDGPDLKTRLAGGALAPLEIAAIFGRLFEGLEHAHARAVVHRDLKPANVLLAASGAKLADFGIARLDPATLARSQAVTRLTETAVILGSLPYMSPEQKRGAPVDGRSDLFSAGVMLYEAATGTLPQGAFALPSALDRRLGRAFDALVMRLLQPDPARRLRSAAEAGQALAGALGTRARAKVFASRAAVAAGLTLVALFATLGGWTALRRGPSRPKAPLAVASRDSVIANPGAEPLAVPEAGAPVDLPPQGAAPEVEASKRDPSKVEASKAVNPRLRVDVKVAPVSSGSRAKSKSAQRPVWLGSKFWPSSTPQADAELQAERVTDKRRPPEPKLRTGGKLVTPLPKQARQLDRE